MTTSAWPPMAASARHVLPFRSLVPKAIPSTLTSSCTCARATRAHGRCAQPSVCILRTCFVTLVALLPPQRQDRKTAKGEQQSARGALGGCSTPKYSQGRSTSAGRRAGANEAQAHHFQVPFFRRKVQACAHGAVNNIRLRGVVLEDFRHLRAYVRERECRHTGEMHVQRHAHRRERLGARMDARCKRVCSHTRNARSNPLTIPVTHPFCA